jgi:PKHD-type hydroxylase
VSDDKRPQHLMLARTLPGVLSPADCEIVKQAALEAGLSRSMVRTSKRLKASHQRTSYQAVLPRTPELEWLYERMLAVGRKGNAEHWRFALTGIETLQVLRYRPRQRFKWHHDVAPGSGRKLTCIVSLVPPGSYWRGGLELMAAHQDGAFAPLQGSATLFPSYIMHRATAPWWGERWALVAWFTGPDMV